MKKRNITGILIMLIIVFAIIIADLLTKHFTTGIDSDVIPGFFKFYYTENSGAAWSMFSGNTVALLVLSIIAVALLLGYSIYASIKSKFFYISIALIIGGALGNMFDRFVFGYVRDFIKLQFMNFPIFNLADCALTVGVALLCIYLIINAIQEARKERKNGKSN